MHHFIMHCNFGEIGQKFATYGRNTVEGICKMAAEIGYDGVEFRSSVPADKVDMDFDTYLNEIVENKKKYGLSELLFGIGIGEAPNPDKEVRQKSIDKACEALKIINDKCGVTLFNCFGKMIRSSIATVPQPGLEFHGSAAATEEDRKLTVDAFQKLAEVAKDVGARLAIETHHIYIHDLPVPTRRLIDDIGCANVGVNMDYGNSVFFPTFKGIEETIDIYGDKIFYIHLKNSVKVPGTPSNLSVALSEGLINHTVYFNKLKEVGYNGPIGIENTRQGDREWFAKQDFNYAKKLYNSIF